MKISECTLSKETQDLLYRYFAAAANLYGVIEIGKLLKIYNSQNEPVSEEDFLSFVENMNFKGKYFCVFNQDDIYDDGYFKKTPDFLEMRSFLRNEQDFQKRTQTIMRTIL